MSTIPPIDLSSPRPTSPLEFLQFATTLRLSGRTFYQEERQTFGGNSGIALNSSEMDDLIDLTDPQQTIHQSRIAQIEQFYQLNDRTDLLPTSIDINRPLVVPFRPISLRLANGDLIDLGPSKTTFSTIDTTANPAIWDELKYDFDPLIIGRKSVEIERKRREYQKADENAFLNVTPPPKPPRLRLLDSVRTELPVNRVETVVQRDRHSIDDIKLEDCQSEVQRQIGRISIPIRNRYDIEEESKSDSPVSRASIELVLDTVRRELMRSDPNRVVKKQRVGQAVKALCSLLHRVEPIDLSQALLSIETNNESMDLMVDRLVRTVHRLLTTYCISSNVQFMVQPLMNSGENEFLDLKDRQKCMQNLTVFLHFSDRDTCTIRELMSLEDRLSLQIESMHNLPEQWLCDFDSFIVEAHVMHGSSELCRSARPPSGQSDKHLYQRVLIQSTIHFELPLCIIPRETRLCLVLYGTRHSIDDKQLAWTSTPLFYHNGRMRQDSVLLPFFVSNELSIQPWGPCPLLHSSSPNPVCLVTFPSFDYQIVFPDVLPSQDNHLSRDFSTLDLETQQYLQDIIEDGVIYELTADEREILWEKRQYLREFPSALTLVLASAVGWDWAGLNTIYQLLDEWTPLSPVQALELLLPLFPDKTVRSKAIHWLRSASNNFIFNCLPQLVEALRFETFEHSALAGLLLDVVSDDLRFAFEIYWQLQQRVEHCVGTPYSNRCSLLQEELLNIRGEDFAREMKAQKSLLANLDALAADVKLVGSDTARTCCLQQHLSTLDSSLLSSSTRLPLCPSFSSVGIHVDMCSFYNSCTLPLKIEFRGISTSFGILHKVGDDMRQDSLVLQMIRMMNDIWLDSQLDLKMVVFRCLPTGSKRGMVELVKDCRTLRELQTGQGAVGVFKDDTLKKWLQKQNLSEFDYKVALDNFQRSCAGWCVGTYVLGIGDRHNDNILITSKGHVFHIDFGKYLGDWQMAGGFKRDRVPFIFTADMAYVINDGQQQSTEQYQHFVDFCCRAFNLLRSHHALVVNLLKLMSCSDIPGMTADAVSFVEKNLLLHLNDTEATVQFTRMIEESLRSRFPRWNFLAHTLAQLTSSQSMGKICHPEGLSFVSQVYSLETDSRIESVQVLNCEKWRQPEKIYMYKLEVRRKEESVPSYIFRSYEEFHEFYLKLCCKFPFTSLTPLSNGTNLGRSNVRTVAERRRTDIECLVKSLFQSADEVVHCDLVYTFLHTLLRDGTESERVKTERNTVTPILDRISGELFLRLTFWRGVLNVFVGHAKRLSISISPCPDTYVKCYLKPDLKRRTKRKTRIVRKTRNPTYNETLTYQVSAELLNEYTLEVTVWHCESFKGNPFLGGVFFPLSRLNHSQLGPRGELFLDSWFALARIPSF